MRTYHKCSGISLHQYTDSGELEFDCGVELCREMADRVIYPMIQNGKFYCATCFKAMRSKTFTSWFLELYDISNIGENVNEETCQIGRICEL